MKTCLTDTFPTFAAFWSAYRDGGFSLKKPIPLPKDRINEMYIAHRFYNEYGDEHYLGEEGTFIRKFCNRISITNVEISQRESVWDAIFKKYLLNSQDIYKVKTTSRKDISENLAGQTITRRDEPLLSTEDLLGKEYGSHIREDQSKARADWVRQVETHQPRLNLTREGLRQRKKKLDEKGQPLKDENGNFVYETRKVNGKEEPVFEFVGAWTETEDRVGISRLLQVFALIEIDISKYLYAYEVKSLFITFCFPPPGKYSSHDLITGRRKWTPLAEEEVEEETPTGGTVRKADMDDISEEEYNNLTTPKEPTWYRERLKRREKYLEQRVKRTSAATRQIEQDKLDVCRILIEAHAKKTPRPSVVNFRKVADEVEGYETFKRAIERNIKTETRYEKVNLKAPQLIICLLGDPGVGKTLISGIISKSLGRAFIPLACGGQDNPAFLQGNQPTFRGASFGQILKGMVKWKSSDPVIMLDEAEKVKDASVMDLISFITDRDQNSRFFDILFDFDVDLSKAIIILTMNNRKAVPKWLESRCTFIDIPYLAYQARKKLVRNWLTKDLTKLGMGEVAAKIGDQLIMCCITETWGMRETKANTLVLIQTLVAMDEDKVLPADLNTFSIDDNLPATKVIKYSNGQIIELQKKVDKKKEEDEDGKPTGKTLTVKTEISDWPGYMERK